MKLSLKWISHKCRGRSNIYTDASKQNTSTLRAEGMEVNIKQLVQRNIIAIPKIQNGQVEKLNILMHRSRS